MSTGKYVIPSLRKKVLEDAEKREEVAKNGGSHVEEKSPFKRFSGFGKPVNTSFGNNSRLSSNWGAEMNPKPRSAFGYSRDEESEEELFKKQTNSGINFDKYEDIPVSVKGKDCPAPIADFADLTELDLSLRKNIKRAGYVKPTPVQKHAIPIVIGGKDLMACAQTVRCFFKFSVVLNFVPNFLLIRAPVKQLPSCSQLFRES